MRVALPTFHDTTNFGSFLQAQAIVAPLLNEFTKIAVREQEAAEWVDELTGTTPAVVCDPYLHSRDRQSLGTGIDAGGRVVWKDRGRR